MIVQRLLILAAALALGACGVSTPVRDLERAVETTPRERDAESVSTTLEAIPLPYSQMAVSIDGGPPGRMALARIVDGVQEWIAFDGRTLWLRGGRIVGTRGFRSDLLRAVDVLPPVVPVPVARGTASQRSGAIYAEGTDRRLGGIYTLTLAREGGTRPVLMGKDVVDLVQVTERVSREGEAVADNRYWVDPVSGTVEISRQRIPGTRHTVVMQRLYPDYEKALRERRRRSREGAAPVADDAADAPVAAEQN